MTQKNLGILFLALAMGGFSAGTVAGDAPIYGSQLMTNQERIEHRNLLRNAKTVEEREQIRLQHHEQMQLRAKERGVTLPDVPPAQGGGMGRRMGPGGGMGPGMGGMGPGGGMGGMGPGRNR